MKKRAAKRTIRRTASRSHGRGNYIVLVRGWMFVVAFALMLGVGALVGSFVNQQLGSEPAVAGVSVTAE